MKRSHRTKPLPHTFPGENRAELAVTVFWMLTMILSLAADVGFAACRLSMLIWPVVPGGPDVRRAMIAALVLVALITGILCLVLTPLVWRLRSVKPPLLIALAAVLVGIAPIVTLIILSFLA